MLRPRLAIAALITAAAVAGGITAGVISSHRAAAAPTTTAQPSATTGQPQPVPTTTTSAATTVSTARAPTTHATTGEPSGPLRISDPAKAADHLFDAWQSGRDSRLALLAASTQAVQTLFAIEPTPRPRFSGCQFRNLGFACRYGYSDANGVLLIDMRVEGGASAGYRVVSVEAPLRFSTPNASAKHLLDTWRAGDRAAALQAASKSAVNAMFSLADRSDPPKPLGCTFRSIGFDCAYTSDAGRLVMRVEGGASAGWFVVAVTEVTG
jgi:hypothetical protein